jgi:hypothetical protein
MSAFATYLKEKGITAEALLAKSKLVERLKDGDLKLIKERRDARKAEKKLGKDVKIDKPNTGRGLSERQVAAAIAGDTALTQRTRAKLARAVKAITGDDVDSRALFAGIALKRGKSIKPTKKR